MIELDTEIVEEKTFTLFDRKVQVIILNINNEKSNLPKPTYEVQILGKSMTKWVEDSMKDYPVTVINALMENDVTTVIAPYLTDSDYTVVLYCDTPLLTKDTIENALDYVSAKGMQVCKLDRGYIFSTQYVKNADKIYAPKAYSFNPDEFFAVTNVASLVKVTEILQQRINDFHIRRGVAILQPATTTIGPYVRIGNGVVIMGNNTIMGETILSDNVVLKENNMLRDAIILQGASIKASVVRNSVVMENAEVMPFCNIENNSIVKKGEKVASFSNFNNRR